MKSTLPILSALAATLICFATPSRASVVYEDTLARAEGSDLGGTEPDKVNQGGNAWVTINNLGVAAAGIFSGTSAGSGVGVKRWGSSAMLPLTVDGKRTYAISVDVMCSGQNAVWNTYGIRLYCGGDPTNENSWRQVASWGICAVGSVKGTVANDNPADQILKDAKVKPETSQNLSLTLDSAAGIVDFAINGEIFATTVEPLPPGAISTITGVGLYHEANEDEAAFSNFKVTVSPDSSPPEPAQPVQKH